MKRNRNTTGVHSGLDLHLNVEHLPYEKMLLEAHVGPKAAPKEGAQLQQITNCRQRFITTDKPTSTLSEQGITPKFFGLSSGLLFMWKFLTQPLNLAVVFCNKNP